MARVFLDQKNLIKKLSKLAVLWVFLFLYFISFSPTFAATYYWNQSDWTSGADESNSAKHSTDQSGWTKYFSKDSNLVTESGLLKLSSTTNQLNYSYSDFGSGSTLSSVEFNASNQLQLSMSSGDQQVSVGANHGCALKNDGTVWCWGTNGFGQIGVGNTLTQQIPVQVLGAGGTGYLTDVTQLSSGVYNTCALKNDSTVWCWGYNAVGQLGDNSTTNRYYPVKVLGAGATGVLTDVAQISSGPTYTCALKSDNTVWCWGYNTYGQLGDNSTSNRYYPAKVVGAGGSGSLTGVSQISSGGVFACALKTDSTVWCWGRGVDGSLGYGAVADKLYPIQVVSTSGVGSTLSGINQISTGVNHACGVRSSDSSLVCWGYGTNGVLGNGLSVGSSYPVQVLGAGASGTLTGVSKITSGVNSTFAIKNDGTLWAWGYGTSGQLGNNSTANKSSPTQVVGLGGTGVLTGVSQVATPINNTNFACSLKSDGSVYCWGDNTYSQLGTKNNTQSNYPVQTFGPPGTGGLANISSVSVGSQHACALKNDGTAWCWGRNNSGQIGIGTTINKGYPVQVTGVGGTGFLTNISQVASGQGGTCALKSDGTVWCWGYNGYGQLGIGTTANKYYPVQVVGVGGTEYLTDVSQIISGETYVCVIKTDNTLFCWGRNDNGQLGIGTTANKYYPVQVVGVGGTGTLPNILQVATGSSHTCALNEDNITYCWGSNSNGRLGVGNITSFIQPYPSIVLDSGGTGVLSNVSKLFSSNNGSCVTKTDGTAWCWGANSYGQLGIGNTTNSIGTPTRVLGAGGTGILNNVSQMALGVFGACAVKDDETSWCWGTNQYGQLGIGYTSSSNPSYRTYPYRVVNYNNSGYLTNVSKISTRFDSTCIIKTDNTVWCWGADGYGQLGDNSSINKGSPVSVIDSDGDFFLRLAGYASQGYLISPVFDLTNSIGLSQLSYVKDLLSGTSVKIQFRSASSQDGLTSADWIGSNGSGTYFTADNSDISNVSLQRYMQYKVTLESSNISSTPTFTSLSLGYNAYTPSGFLITSPFDTESAESLISNVSWIKSTPTNTSIKMQIRSSSSLDTLSSKDWLGPDGTSSSYFTDNLGQDTPASLRDGSADRWVQYKIILETSDTSVTPTLYDSTLTYVVNAPPQFDTSYGTNGFSVTRGSTPGVLNFSYKVRDPDTNQGSTANQYKLWPVFQYTLDNGDNWTTISPDQISGYSSDNNLSLGDTSTYVEGTSTWDATTALANTYGTMKIRVVIDDHEAANNTATVTSDAFIFDNKVPTVGTVDGGGSGININHNQTTSLALDKTNNRNVVLYFSASDDSALQLRYSDNSSFTGASYQNYVSSVGYTLPSGDGSKRVYVQFKDAYGNTSDVYSDVIQLDTTAPTVGSLYIQDVTNLNTSEYRLFINWPKSTDIDWKNYKIYRMIDNGAYDLMDTITNVNSNYILQDSLDSTKTYSYKVTSTDDLSNESIGSSITQSAWGNSSDTIAPTVSNIQTSNKTTNSITISWTTNEISNSNVLYSTDFSFSDTKGDTGYSKTHSITLTGLTAGTQYNFKVRSSDASGNATDSTADTFTTTEADDTGPVISSIASSDISISRATITFTTDEAASSFVEYSTTSGFTSGQIVGQNELVTSHTVYLKSLSSSTTYYYKVRSSDAAGNQTVSDQKSFTTSADTSDKIAPIISNTSVSNIKYNTATVSFTTNENASSFVEFGKDISYGRIYGRDDSVTSHSVTLPYDLKPSTVYYYRVRTKDLSNNETIGVGSSFVTADDPNDLTAPAISNITIGQPHQNTVTITWTTNEVATSIIGFSQDLNFSQEQGNSTMTTSHSVTLVGLQPNTTYYFKVKSTDPSGNLSYDNNSSQGYQFSTAAGSTPPVISANQIKNVATSSADIYWETDVNTNSYVEYGLDEAYGIWAGLNDTVKNHTVSLSGLLSGATYNFRVRSSSGNAEAVSSNFTLTTQSIAVTTPVSVGETTSTSTDPSEETILDKIKNGTTDFVKKVLDIIPDTSLSEDDFIDKMTSLSPKIVSSPAITSGNITVDPGVDKITISWTTDKKSNSVVVYTPESNYNSGSTSPYTSEVGNYDESVTSHSVDITNLNPNTTYHYKVKSKTEYGNWTESKDFSFTTLSVTSEVRDLRFTKVGQNSVTTEWSTSFESRAMIEVIDVLSGKSLVKTEEQGFTRDHKFTTDQLQNSTNYQLKITTVAKDGTISDPTVYPFSTSTSTEPPAISNVRISNALISGAVEQVQTIISWKTDKPSTSRLVYNEGMGTDFNQGTNIDKSLVTDHVVVTTNLKTGKVYKFKVESVDAAQNKTLSKEFLIMTPKPQESVLNLIINNFTSSFSFITKGKK